MAKWHVVNIVRSFENTGTDFDVQFLKSRN